MIHHARIGFLIFLINLVNPAPHTLSEELDEILRSQNCSIVGEECRNGPGSECYEIRDLVYIDENGVSATRKLEAQSETATRLVLSKLKTPSSLTAKNAKVNKWPVDKNFVINPYAQLLIANGYLSGVLPLDEIEKKKVLVVGMRGGMVSNFFTTRPNIKLTIVEKDPFFVEIAQKYFGHEDVQDKVSVYVADPTEFLEQAVLKNDKYNFIVIDQSYDWDETGTGLICPVPKYLDENVILNIYDALDDDGVVTVNINAVDNIVGNENRVFKPFGEIFPSCSLSPLFPSRNLLFCSKKTNWTWQKQKGQFRKNVKTFIKKFHFDHLQLLSKY